MNKVERIKLVKAMEFITRNINDEDVFEDWLRNGVADGDIPYGSLSIENDDLENLEYYIEDESFADIMDTFLVVMKGACKSGGLYCDKVVSGVGNKHSAEDDDEEDDEDDESEI